MFFIFSANSLPFHTLPPSIFSSLPRLPQHLLFAAQKLKKGMGRGEAEKHEVAGQMKKFELHTQFLRTVKNHAGIVIAPQQTYSIGEQMRRLLRMMHSLTAQEMMNRVEFLSAWGSR